MNDEAVPGPDPAAGEPPELTEAERELLEQQMKEIRIEDLLAQSVASILNLSARRILKEDEVDLGQARLGIDAVRALAGLLPAEVGAAIQEPLSQVQLLYAQRSGGKTPGGPAGPGGPEAGGSGEAPPGRGPGPDDGPAASGPGKSGLWVPGR